MYRLAVMGSAHLQDTMGGTIHSVLAQHKRFALLVYLALARPRGFHSRDALAAMFWPELPEERARANLRKTLHHLRKSLGDDLLTVRGTGDVRIETAHLDCDVWRLEEAMTVPAVDVMTRYHGPLLPGFHIGDADPFMRWLDEERTRIQLEAVSRVLALAESDHERALDSARWVLALEPYNERAARRAMELLDRVGDRGAAMTVFDTLERVLEEEWDSEPSPETLALQDEILARVDTRETQILAGSGAERVPASGGAMGPEGREAGAPGPRRPADARRSQRPVLGGKAVPLAAAVTLVLASIALLREPGARGPASPAPRGMEQRAGTNIGTGEADAMAFVELAVDQMFGGAATGPYPDQKAAELLDSALAYAPHLTDALAWKAINCYALSTFGIEGAADTAVAFGRRAVASDSTRSLPHMALGMALYSANRDPSEVLEALIAAGRRPAEGEVKDFGDAFRATYTGWGRFDRAHLWNLWHAQQGRGESGPSIAFWKWIGGDVAAGVVGIQRNISLDPARMIPREALAKMYLARGRVDQAREVLARIRDDLRVDPPATLSALVALHADDCDEVIRVLANHPQVVEPSPLAIDYVVGVRATTLLGYCLLRVGRPEEGGRYLDLSEQLDLHVISRGADNELAARYDLVRVLAARGDAEEALSAFEDAVDRGWPYVNTNMGAQDPILHPLRDEPRFYAALRRAQEHTAEQVATYLRFDDPPPTLEQILAIAQADLEKARKGIPPVAW